MTLCADKKQDVRLQLKSKRAAISSERRKEAADTLICSLVPVLKSFKTILSFHSLSEEIDTVSLNFLLAKERRLLLPRVNGSALIIYRIEEPDRELLQAQSRLMEPDPDQCKRIEIEKIGCILIPGLGFDRRNRRIGYGKGHYDRLLAQIKLLPAAPKMIGLGFKEQFVEEGLPCEAHDVALDEVFLY